MVVDQTLNDIIQIAIQHETENNTSEVILNKNLYNIDKVGLSQIKKRVHIFEENTVIYELVLYQLIIEFYIYQTEVLEFRT